jgi:hypothetical protein
MTEEESKLRDEFAKVALAGILAAIGSKELVVHEIAAEAYDWADAMLAERNKKR